jgi:hypothetical protein
MRWNMADRPTYEFSNEGLKRALTALGDSAALVGQKLLTMGFKGQRNLCKVCPVARYLLAVIEGADDVSVHEYQAFAYRTVVEYTEVTSEVASAVLPVVVQAFVEDFDDGVFPELDSEVPDAVAH